MEQTELLNNYKYHKPNQSRAIKHEEIRKKMLLAALYLNDVLPDSREKSLALTKIEEATMWANASLARKGE